MADPDRVVVYFDGVCNLCNRAVDFIIRHDRAAKIKFASLQSPTGVHALEKLGFSPKEFKTIILEVDGALLVKSDAALEIAGMLDGPVRFWSCCKLVPRCIRDPLYMLISNNRYRWFGRKSSCRLPVEGEMERFID